MIILGEKIANFRKQSGMTQDELAEKIGVSAQTVSKWENSVTMPDVMLLPIIADVFNISIDELYGLNGKMAVDDISADDVPNRAYDLLLETIQRLETDDKMRIREKADETKKEMQSNPNCQTAVFSRHDSAIYANSELGIVFNKTDEDEADLLLDDDAIKFISAMSNRAVLQILAHIIKNPEKGFTVATIANHCAISLGEAKTAVELLNKYSFVNCRPIELEDKQVNVYGLFGGHKLLLVYTIMRLARRLCNYRECYRGFYGSPKWFC